MILPEGGREILEARKRGLAPADPVIVDFTGSRMNAEPLINADPVRRYDWRFLKGLPVYVVTRNDVPTINSFLADIAKVSKGPVEVYYPNINNGETVYWSPSMSSVDAYLAGKIPNTAIKWEIERWEWMKFMVREWERFYREATQ